MVRSLERSERIYNAMAARGYQGQIQVLDPPHMTRQDFTTLLLSTLYLLTITIASLLMVP